MYFLSAHAAPKAPTPIDPSLLDASDAWWVLGILFIITFLLGSIPWGVIISKIAFKRDIRDAGSGNIGTTNAIRTLGKVGGAAVFILDFGKGLLAGYFGMLASNTIIFPSSWLDYTPLAIAFIGCIWGHIFSPWLKFKGGKGVAVAVGALFYVFGPIGTLIEIAVFAIIVLVSRYVSLGSLAAAIICPFIATWIHFGCWMYVGICTLAAITVIWAHRSNIKRLINGAENRIGDKEKS